MKTCLSVALGVMFPIACAAAQDQGASLRQAIFAGDAAQVATLAKSKTTVNSADGNGITPLMIAAAVGQSETIKTLIAGGAELRRRRRPTRSPR